MTGDRMDVVVTRLRAEADGVLSIELKDPGAEPLPPFAAGAHIDVELPLAEGVQVRQYSLCNDPTERHRYVIGVGLDANSRGGSRWIHAALGQGARLRIAAPRSNFPLAEQAAHTVLVAGGIGITPMLAMAHRLAGLGKRWTLYYCVRTPARAAFLHELLALGGEVIPVYDGVPGVASLDLSRVVAQASPDTHLYCCGPAGLMKAFLAATAGRDAATVHVEWFAAPAADAKAAAGPEGSFEVRLARTQRTLHVPPDQSILDVLLDAGVDVSYSCRDGVCGTCETKVLAGECDHRDLVLTHSEAAANNRMMVCVSRCKGASLTLDL